MTEKRFTYFKSKIGFGKQGIDDNLKGYTFDFTMDNVLDCMNDLADENEQLKQQIKDLRIDVLDSIYEANEIQCTCNPCVVEECVKKVIENDWKCK